MCIVAFTRQNLHHLGHFLSVALLGPSVHSEPNICSVTGKLPPVQRQKPKMILLSLYYVFKFAAEIINKTAGCPVPQEAAGCLNFILQLEDGAATDGHTAVILDLHRVLDVV